MSREKWTIIRQPHIWYTQSVSKIHLQTVGTGYLHEIKNNSRYKYMSFVSALLSLKIMVDAFKCTIQDRIQKYLKKTGCEFLTPKQCKMPI